MYVYTYIETGPTGISRLAIAIASYDDINERDSEGCTPLFYAAGDRQVCVFVCVSIYIYIYIYVCVCVCLCLYVCVCVFYVQLL